MMYAPITAEVDEVDRDLDDAISNALPEWVELAQKRQDMSIPPRRRSIEQTRALKDRIEDLESSIAMFARRAGLGTVEFEKLCAAEQSQRQRLPGQRRPKPQRAHATEEDRLAYLVEQDTVLLERFGREREAAQKVVSQRLRQISLVGQRLADNRRELDRVKQGRG